MPSRLEPFVAIDCPARRRRALCPGVTRKTFLSSIVCAGLPFIESRDPSPRVPPLCRVASFCGLSSLSLASPRPRRPEKGETRRSAGVRVIESRREARFLKRQIAHAPAPRFKGPASGTIVDSAPSRHDALASSSRVGAFVLLERYGTERRVRPVCYETAVITVNEGRPDEMLVYFSLSSLALDALFLIFNSRAVRWKHFSLTEGDVRAHTPLFVPFICLFESPFLPRVE